MCHPTTDLCRILKERNRQNLVAKEEQSGEEMEFKAYGKPLVMVSSFKYLGKVL